MERIVSASPTLNAAYLQRLDQMQADIARIVHTREADAGRPCADTDPAPEAVVGAALACVTAARRLAASWQRTLRRARRPGHGRSVNLRSLSCGHSSRRVGCDLLVPAHALTTLSDTVVEMVKYECGGTIRDPAPGDGFRPVLNELASQCGLIGLSA